MELNERQAAAVTHRGTPLLIVAGAGSGKTRALTERIVSLVQNKEVRTGEILAITFTNKAAREMRERVLERLGPAAASMWIMTFHRASLEILRRDIDRLGYPRRFSVYDSSDQMAVVRQVIKNLGLDDKRFPASMLHSKISRAKNEGLTAGEIRAQGGFFEDRLAAVMEGYQERLVSQGALDFDDLIGLTIRLLEEQADVRDAWQSRFRHILVDEYQDTNPAQYRWLRLLAGGGAEVAVVGDPDQSIYGWRGADIRNILEFEKDFPGAEVIILDRNYRSTRTILDVANAVVQKVDLAHRKELWTDKDPGDPVRFMELPDDRSEAEAVALEIRDLRHRGTPLGDIAILFRVNAQSRSLEEALLRYNMGYRLVGGVRFYEREEVKNVIAYLRLVLNPKDEMALRRVINVPRRGIGDKTIEKLLEEGSLSEGLWEMPQRLAGQPGLKVAAFMELIEEMRAATKGMSLAVAVLWVAEKSGIMGALKAEATDEAEGRIENVLALQARAKEAEDEGDDMEAFLGRIALMADADEVDQGAEAVTLMTLHAAKGLEFRAVFLTGMEEGLLPHSRALYDESELEEERRLFYVGVTRAKENLYLLRAMRRMIFGEAGQTMTSRFLDDVPPKLMVNWRPPASAQRLHPAAKPGRPSVEGLLPGDKVAHPVFGRGTIVSTRGEGEDAELKVAFDGAGIKSLVARYAGLSKTEG